MFSRGADVVVMMLRSCTEGFGSAMKTRQAKKIIGCQWQNTPPYWWQRAWDTIQGKKNDHRVMNALRIRQRHERNDKYDGE